MESLVDAVIALAVLEGLALAVYHRRTGRGVPPADLAPNLLAGLALLLALRFALAGAGAIAIMLCLTGALGAHCADLARRWRAGPSEAA